MERITYSELYFTQVQTLSRTHFKVSRKSDVKYSSIILSTQGPGKLVVNPINIIDLIKWCIRSITNIRRMNGRDVTLAIV